MAGALRSSVPWVGYTNKKGSAFLLCLRFSKIGSGGLDLKGREVGWLTTQQLAAKLGPGQTATKGAKMDGLFVIFGWGSPVGIGIFLVCLGTMIWLLAKADEISKRTKAMMKEKGLGKK
ncbi:hypothetical protein ACFLTN_00920 [Chloroflexota bacterium]